MTLDQVCRIVLMSAYLYYQRGESILADDYNDKMVKFLYNNWDKIPDRYIPLLDPFNDGKESINGTTYRCAYTRLIEGGALAWLKEKTGKKLERLNEGYYEANVTSRIDISNLF